MISSTANSILQEYIHVLMAKFIVQEYIRVLIFKKLWFYPCIYPWPVTFFRHKSRKNYWRILGFINELS